MSYKVVVFSQIDQDILIELQSRYEVVVLNPKSGDINQQLLSEVCTADALIGAGRVLDQTNLHTATRLKVISSVSVGYDNYDLEYLNQKNIKLTNTPHVLTAATADLAWTLLLAAARRVPALDAWTKQGLWTRSISKHQFGLEVTGKTIGIIGLGEIGSAIAKRAHLGFDMRVLYHNRSENPARAKETNARYVPLTELLQQSDFVVVSVDLNSSSQVLIGKKELKSMQPHAVLVNISRGAVIDEKALIEALQHNDIFAAGLDVYQQEPLAVSELFQLPNVVTLPHIGSATIETRKKMAELALKNLIDVLEKGTSDFCVN